MWEGLSHFVFHTCETWYRGGGLVVFYLRLAQARFLAFDFSFCHFLFLFFSLLSFSTDHSAAQSIGWVLLLAAGGKKYSKTGRPEIRVCCILSLPSDEVTPHALGVPYIPCLCLRHRSPLSSPGPCSRKAPIRSAFAVPLDNPPEMPTTLLFFSLSKSSTLRGKCSDVYIPSAGKKNHTYTAYSIFLHSFGILQHPWLLESVLGEIPYVFG